MGLAEDIAGGIKSKAKNADVEVEVEDVKSGDVGKRILAAIKQNDAEALESAIRDCCE